MFRAVAVLSRVELSGCDGGGLPIAYFGQHGINDSVLGINLGCMVCRETTTLRHLKSPHWEVECIQPRITRIASQGTLSSGLRLTVIIYRIPSDAGSSGSFTGGLIREFFS